MKPWSEEELLYPINTKFQNISDLIPLFEKEFGYSVSYAVLVRAIHVLGLRRRRGRFYA